MPLATWCVWQLLATVAFVPILGFRENGAFWQWRPDVLVYIASLAVAHLAAVGVLFQRLLRLRAVRARHVLGATTIAYSVWSLGIFLARFSSYESRGLLVMALCLSNVLALLPLMVSQRLYRGLVLTLVLVSGLSLVSRSSVSGPSDMPAEGSGDRLATTAFYLVKLVTHKSAVPSAATGGGLEVLGAGLLAGAGDGGLHFLNQGARRGSLISRKLPYRVPINREEFVEDTGLTGPDEQFRVADIMVHTLGDRLRLSASHHYWHRESRCHTVRVSEAEVASAGFLEGSAPIAWRLVYETKPCLPMLTGDFPFVGIQVGGRMARLDRETILLALGDMGFDGWNSDRNLPQDSEADYGKTIRINRRTGEAQVYTSGHRNPQGLYVMPDRTIWLTEHGPQGGDELNLLREGANYGWPRVTYGTDYGLASWPLSEEQGQHTGYEAPVFAWVPSIGISSVISVQQDLFSTWRGDLLIASLNTKTLFRVKVERGRAAVVEPIISARGKIRDIAEAADGRVVMLLDDGAVGVMEPVLATSTLSAAGAPEDASQEQAAGLFAGCHGCHPTGDGSTHGIGPDLHGVVGREIASAPGFRYSAALSRLSGEWTKERLDGYLADPQVYAPGTSMRVGPIHSAESRSVLIKYLASH